uniref:ATP synthase complex subunit 8 n=1 Tax=Physemacris variolosa TaxID=62778 RepID=E0YCJ0_9ORTH|nr:ATP synthase F0 subunit 8 [Physemacris variolosa]ADD97025.1 ATP synthase F0 subunit 8 [Physemacris variolosa]
MPQMAPMMWSSMFILFTITTIMFNTTNFFVFIINTPNKLNAKSTIKSMNWKW